MLLRISKFHSRNRDVVVILRTSKFLSRNRDVVVVLRISKFHSRNRDVVVIFIHIHITHVEVVSVNLQLPDENKITSNRYMIIVTSTNEELERASSMIWRQVPSLLSNVGALPRMNKEDLALVNATFILRVSIYMLLTFVIKRGNGQIKYLIRNRLIADEDLHGHKKE